VVFYIVVIFSYSQLPLSPTIDLTFYMLIKITTKSIVRMNFKKAECRKLKDFFAPYIVGRASYLCTFLNING
jgi:hypothetical protein